MVGGVERRTDSSKIIKTCFHDFNRRSPMMNNHSHSDDKKTVYNHFKDKLMVYLLVPTDLQNLTVCYVATAECLLVRFKPIDISFFHLFTVQHQYTDNVRTNVSFQVDTQMITVVTLVMMYVI